MESHSQEHLLVKLSPSHVECGEESFVRRSYDVLHIASLCSVKALKLLPVDGYRVSVDFDNGGVVSYIAKLCNRCKDTLVFNTIDALQEKIAMLSCRIESLTGRVENLE
jgi:hypothetical protein